MAFRQEQVSKTRRELFRQSVLSAVPAVEPWSFGKGEFQAWLREAAGEDASDSLKFIIDLMGDVDGLTVLSEWVEVGFDALGKANVGKLNLNRVKEGVKGNKIKPAAVSGQLAPLLGVLAQGKRAEAKVKSPGALSFYKAVLQSCEKRSLLTDYLWIKMVGEGAFGRAHLCR